MNYKYLLIEIDRRRRLRGKELQPACTKNQLEQLAAKVREELNTELPKDYTELLSYTNGISYNGLVIYASEKSLVQGTQDVFIPGFVEANLLHRSDSYYNDFLIFGEGNMDYYTLYLPDRLYRVIDRVPGNVIAIFPSFDELMRKALQDHL
ncbi:MAG: hypothetical protein KatS3mg055_2304 [Chloroflexus sp.]|uniref:YrhA family protein n=1 Tax=Chloroflexus sp. TaxID=1904827 RepID=UPI0021DE3D22|nr:YrhA family protein [Chloroflexus sp.]GIV89786.1 MAG: hypothetical protein KatS3mg055_2304 [Chloroflexus sp.]